MLGWRKENQSTSTKNLLHMNARRKVNRPQQDEFISVGDMTIGFSNYLLNSLNINNPMCIRPECDYNPN
jgi:hypothetical protein